MLSWRHNRKKNNKEKSWSRFPRILSIEWMNILVLLCMVVIDVFVVVLRQSRVRDKLSFWFIYREISFFRFHCRSKWIVVLISISRDFVRPVPPPPPIRNSTIFRWKIQYPAEVFLLMNFNRRKKKRNSDLHRKFWNSTPSFKSVSSSFETNRLSNVLIENSHSFESVSASLETSFLQSLNREISFVEIGFVFIRKKSYFWYRHRVSSLVWFDSVSFATKSSLARSIRSKWFHLFLKVELSVHSF